MPYIWSDVHDVTYTEPPGRMSFVDDWGLNPVYDELTNPSPVQRLIFNLTTVFRPGIADVSLARSEERYFNVGYVWLRKQNFNSDCYFEEIRYQSQYLFSHEWIDIRSISDLSFSQGRFDAIDLHFNTSKVSSVRLMAFPPPTWVDP